MACITIHDGSPPDNENKELQRLLDLATLSTGKKWFAKTAEHTVKRWFLKDRYWYYTSLMVDIGNGQAEVINCVRTDREAIAYMYGVLIHSKRANNA